MTKDIDKYQQYASEFSELLAIINLHHSRASQAVNNEQLLTAWNVGSYVSGKLKSQRWGSKVVTQFAEYMKVKVLTNVATADETYIIW